MEDIIVLPLEEYEQYMKLKNKIGNRNVIASKNLRVGDAMIFEIPTGDKVWVKHVPDVCYNFKRTQIPEIIEWLKQFVIKPKGGLMNR